MVLLRPCTTSAGFLATPERARRVDMARLKDILSGAGYHVVVDARVLLIVRPQQEPGTESSIHDDGKVLLKTTESGEAEAAYASLRPHLEACWRTG